MATVVKEARYIFADIGDNHNKYWHILMYDDNSVETQWGRIGDAGQTKTFPQYGSYEANKFFESKCREKTKKGYREQKTLGGTIAQTKVVSSSTLAQVAKEQIKTNSPDTIRLVESLIKANVHNILSATTLSYNDTTGLFSTPLGIVTGDALAEARVLLDSILGYVTDADYSNYKFQQVANDYLNIIPQVIERRKPSVETIFPSVSTVQKQSQILDSLEGSLQVALKGGTNGTVDNIQEKVFECKLSVVESGKVYDRIINFYKHGVRNGHTSARLNIDKIYEVDIAPMTAAYEKSVATVGNPMEVWHGTLVGNLLSILKSGLKIRPSGAKYTGSMYGDGIYGSDISTKALNYSAGYWSGTRESQCYMFLMDMLMGKTYYPGSSYGGGYSSRYPVSGYDSTFAKGGSSGVINNEMIVYKTNQIKLKYLVECK